MLDRINLVKRKMEESLAQLCDVSWMFSKQPGKDFTRERKLPFLKTISFMLAMEGRTLATELLSHFGYSAMTASASAFVQQRSKLSRETFPTLFDLFVRKTQPFQFYKGYRLFAADGSDIRVPSNPDHTSSHYPGANGQSPYNVLHLDALMIYSNTPTRMQNSLATENPMNPVRYVLWLTVPMLKRHLSLQTETMKAIILWLIFRRKVGNF